ncbi:MAG TPA: extracellular solute-binding protein [Syntrophomonadaceae bacterium]|nr:extracellular solute-binding protein [Syntrophomonadaceae bacterium]
MKKIISLSFVLMLLFIFAVGCASSDSQGFDSSQFINVVSREDGSGTRGAFVEIVEVEDADGNDATSLEAVIQNSTNGIMATVAGDKYSIGYISLGSLNDSVTSVSVDGVEATAENVKSGHYKIARPFNIAYKNDISEVAQDFINFILSADGQAIVEENSLVAAVEGDTYSPSGLSGNIVVGGSTSVTPLMEKLAEAYEALNEGVSIEIQSTGSSAGMTGAMEGSLDIGMASRDLKDSEKAELEHQAIAIDGIAVIVNNENTITDLTLEEIQGIYLGEITSWNEVE